MSWIREANAEPIPGYRLIEPLGSGGFGEVWKCEAPGGIFKAIKFVFGNLNSMDVDCVRAEQEQKALQRIKDVRHPFICSLDRIEVVDGELLIVMELAERTLHDVFVECQNAGMIGIPKDNLMRYLRDAAEALDYMNEKHNLQHLDVKPKNLFISGDRIKVADFGLVKNLDRGNSGVLGGVTPLYAPPETFLGKISPFSDQYSLAIVYQEMLTGHRPFQAKNVRQLAQQHMQEDPDLRSLPEHERLIIGKALAKDPLKRYPNCMGMLAALYKAIGTARIEMPSVSKSTASFGSVLRNKTMAETMEDIKLESHGVKDEVLAYEDAADMVDFGGPAPAAPVRGPRPLPVDESQPVQVSDLGVTVPQPETGALRPTLVIGLGSFGRKAILELRCRLMDRFGDLSKLPLIRFLAIDPDPEAINQAVRGAPQVALTRNEFLHTPLQPVGNYRRRNLDHLYEWLPREKLYTMPRSLQTQGSRALGRLAFADNQQRLLARLRREIQEITNSDCIYQAVSQTGLALRDTTPRVYVLAAAGGGSSGMITDLGYGIRRLLAHLRHPDSPVHGFFMAGAPQDPVTPRAELANVYATLTELNHYSDPSILFAAQYGPDGQRIIDEGSPFSSVYFLPLAHRTPEALEETVAHLGCYLFQEMTTPLGLRLDHLRAADTATMTSPQPGQLSTPLRSFGTYGVWFPRGLLLHLAARVASKQLIEQWCLTGETNLTDEARPEIVKLVNRITDHPELDSEALAATIEKNSIVGSPTDAATAPAEVLAAMLSKIDEQSVQSLAQDDPGNWAKQALHRVKEWVGSGESEGELGEWRRTKLTRSLATASARIVDEWDLRIGKELLPLLELPGSRLVAAEAACERLQKWCQHVIEGQKEKLREHTQRMVIVHQQLQAALIDCSAGSSGFRLFGGGRKSRSLRTFLDLLGQFARLRLTEELHAAVKSTYTGLMGKIADRGRDLALCRQRLRHLRENLDFSRESEDDEELVATRSSEMTPSQSPAAAGDAIFDIIRQSTTARVVLPDGEDDLERAALRFLQGLSAEHWKMLDKELSERVLTPRGGLHSACINSGDLTKNLAIPLVRETSVLLAQHLPTMDVADILLSECSSDANVRNLGDHSLSDQVKSYLDRAFPLVQSKDKKNQQAFILVPASKAGRELASQVEEIVPDVQLVKVPGQADLMFLREQGNLTAADLHKLLRPCQAAYEANAGVPTASPHARFDVVDWLPLDP